MISNAPPFKGLNIRVPIIIPVWGLEFWVVEFDSLGYQEGARSVSV